SGTRPPRGAGLASNVSQEAPNAVVSASGPATVPPPAFPLGSTAARLAPRSSPPVAARPADPAHPVSPRLSTASSLPAAAAPRAEAPSAPAPHPPASRGTERVANNHPAPASPPVPARPAPLTSFSGVCAASIAAVTARGLYPAPGFVVICPGYALGHQG